MKIEEMCRMQKEMSEQGNQSLRPRLWKRQISKVENEEGGSVTGQWGKDPSLKVTLKDPPLQVTTAHISPTPLSATLPTV